MDRNSGAMPTRPAQLPQDDGLLLGFYGPKTAWRNGITRPLLRVFDHILNLLYPKQTDIAPLPSQAGRQFLSDHGSTREH